MLFLHHHCKIFGERLKILLVRDFVLKDLQHDVVRHWVFSLSRLQELFVEADGAALALDVLIENRLDERVIRRVVTAIGHLVPLFRLGHRRAAELDDPARDQPA